MATAPNLTAKNVARSVIIIMSFVAVWTFVLFIIGIQEFWTYGKKVKETKKVRSDTNLVAGGAEDSYDTNISTVMKEYIDSYLPYVYKELTRSQQLSRQLLLNHKYFAILTNTKNTVDKTSKWVDGFHVLSMVSANMFILAMLFDLRYPADDGTTTITITTNNTITTNINTNITRFLSYVQNRGYLSNQEDSIQYLLLMGPIIIIIVVDIIVYIQ
jgi:hypothetical protein